MMIMIKRITVAMGISMEMPVRRKNMSVCFRLAMMGKIRELPKMINEYSIMIYLNKDSIYLLITVNHHPFNVGV